MSKRLGNSAYTKIYKNISSDGHKRQDNDFYATDPIALELLSKKVGIPKNIWEPCCGEGHLSKWLVENGCNVYSSDLVDRGYGVGGVDFFLENSLRGRCSSDNYAILTNPPFKRIDDFVLHALELLKDNQKLLVFAKTTFLEGKARYDKIFSKNPPEYMYQFSQRVMCAMNGNFEYASSAISYAWYQWTKGKCSTTKIIWI